jgi:hypothetical protein
MMFFFSFLFSCSPNIKQILESFESDWTRFWNKNFIQSIQRKVELRSEDLFVMGISVCAMRSSDIIARETRLLVKYGRPMLRFNETMTSMSVPSFHRTRTMMMSHQQDLNCPFDRLSCAELMDHQEHPPNRCVYILYCSRENNLTTRYFEWMISTIRDVFRHLFYCWQLLCQLTVRLFYWV